MKVETTRFGTVDIDDGNIVKLVKGPLGFDEQTDYCLIHHRPDTKFRWLQSTQEPALAFVVVDPADFFQDYEVEIPDAEAATLHLESADDALVLLVVTIANQGKDVSANLAAPIVVNSREMIGLQVVLQDTGYSVKHPLLERSQENESKIEKREAVTAKAA